MSIPQLLVDRRVTLRWFLAAAAAGPLAACDGLVGGSWPNLKPLDGPRISRDPDYNDTAAPWPLTMSEAELRTTTTLVDLILPAEGEHPSASQVGVPAFINEWVSAPYELQQTDRGLIIPGLAWIDKEAKKRGAADFAGADAAVQTSILDDIAFKDRVKAGLEKPAEFFERLRAVTLGGYYTTPEGWADIGYKGNSPMSGPYPGPTPEALDHIRQAAARNNLKIG